jgi:pimeloyl-ACP methyl ester carboxylesterase
VRELGSVRAMNARWLLASSMLFLCAANAAGADDSVEVGASSGFMAIDYGVGAERDVVVNGLRLRVHEGGPAGAPVVLLLHCFGLNMKVWRDMIPALEERYRVIAYDAPGHGKSDKPFRTQNLERLAQTAVGLLDALGIEEALWVGNSMGGGTALVASVRSPERVRGLVLVNAVGLDFSPWYGPPWRMLDASHLQGSPDWMWGVAMGLATEKASPLVEEIAADILVARRDVMMPRAALTWFDVVSEMVSTDHTDQLERVRAPTLVITGVHDRLVSPEHAERLAAGIAGARLHVFDDLGHIPEIEDAPALTAVVVPFLDAVVAADAAAQVVSGRKKASASSSVPTTR